jgi:hypothetical protein
MRVDSKTGSMTTKWHLFLSAVWWAQETWRWSPPPRAEAAGLSTLWSNVTHGGFDGLHNV